MKHYFWAEINGVCLVKYINSHVNVYNISSIYGVFTLLGLPEKKSANHASMYQFTHLSTLSCRQETVVKRQVQWLIGTV